MRALRACFCRLAGLLRRRWREGELDEEIESHLQLHVDDLIRSGLSEQEARRQALIRFGSVEAVKEDWRERHGLPLLETTLRDVAYAFRTLGSHKGWTAVALLSLALGIGANTALFSLVHDVLVQKLPVRDPDQLVTFRWAGENNLVMNHYVYGNVAPDPAGPVDASFSFRAFEGFQRANQALTDLFAFAPGPRLNLICDGQADAAASRLVSGRFYQGLGISAFKGRLLLPGDDTPEAAPAAVISHRYWERRFGSDPAVVGRPMTLNGVPATIVGVEPPGFGDLGRVGRAGADISLPLVMEPRLKEAGSSLLEAPWAWWLLIMGRLQPGADMAQVEANLQAVFKEAARQGREEFTAAQSTERRASPGSPLIPALRIVSGNRGIYDSPESVDLQLSILAAVLGTLLLIVCVNLANLLLSRTEGRQREIAVRMALGATRTRVIRQLLTESVVLAALGGAAGLIVSVLCHQLFETFHSFQTPAGFPARLLVFTASVSLGTVVFFGLAPAWHAVRLGRALQSASRRFSHSRSVLNKSLMVLQVALSLVLLVGAGLFLATLTNLRKVEIGFNPDNLVLFTLDLRLGQVDARVDERATPAFFDELVERLAALPGIRSASFSSAALLGGRTSRERIYFEGRETEFRPVSLAVHPDFFRAMEIPLRSGRGFTPADDGSGPAVVVVNEAFAESYLPQTDPTGSRFGFRDEARNEVEIVGVVADTQYNSLRNPAEPMFYRPHPQSPGSVRTFAVRTSGEPGAMVPAIREAVRRLDPNLPLLNVATQWATIERNWQAERMFALSSALFGGLALIISAIGLFGLMSYQVARRTRELGIRMALGAQSRDVLGSVLREALSLVLVGVLIGLGAALTMTRYLESVVFGLEPHDPAIVVAASVLMLSVAAVAGFLPARRAAATDPLLALRHE